MEISNKTLAWLVVAAIVVSIFGTTLSIMNISGRGPAGYLTSNDTGQASVTVSQAVVLRFVAGNNTVAFGSGAINTSGGYTLCNLMINNSAGTGGTLVGCNGFTTSPGALMLENVGTSNLNVTLNFSKNDTDFLPATGGRSGIYFKYTVGNGTDGKGGCKGGTQNATVWGGWTDVGVPNTTVNVCGNLSWITNANRLLIGLNISVNPNITTALQTVTILAQGTGI